MRGERCPTYNAIQNNKFEVKNCNQIKYILYHYETPSYFLVDFLGFLIFLELLLRPQSTHVLEKIVQFSHSQFSNNEHSIQSHSSFVT
jgi:hypothetical protein